MARLPRLIELEQRMAAAGAVRLTLSPSARAPTLPSVLVDEASAGEASEFRAALETGVTRVTLAILEHFPDNLFWDLDGLISVTATDAEGDAARLEEAFDDLVAVHALFGAASPIRFRYVHDFIYGFDWARWVRRDAPSRSAVHPYSRRFVREMLARGHALLEQIAQRDVKYPPLDGPRHRNPFGFSREPEDELRLHRDLADRGLVPVEAWTPQAAASSAREFTRARDERAKALGLRRAT